MKETTRTIILFIVLAVLVAFMFWVRSQNETNLQAGILPAVASANHTR